MTENAPEQGSAGAIIDKLATALTNRSPRHRDAQMKFDRWRDSSVLIEALLEIGPSGRERIMSLDGGAYTVGTANVSTRERWLEKVLGEIPSGARLLDAGAGESQFRKFCGHLQYVSQDIARYTGEGNAIGLQTGKWDTSAIDIVGDITNIPEPDGSFDAVLCTEVLEHLTEPVKALQELARLLKTGGTLIVTAPFCCLTHFAPYHYSTGFTRYFYQHHLTALGFEITDLIENGNFFEFMGQEVRRIEDMSRRYGPGEPTRLERYAIQIVLGMLQRMSDADRGSQEMLHFDYQVRATKVRNP